MRFVRWPSPELFYKAVSLIALNQLVVQPVSLLMSYPTLFEPAGITAFSEGRDIPKPLEIIKVAPTLMITVHSNTSLRSL